MQEAFENVISQVGLGGETLPINLDFTLKKNNIVIQIIIEEVLS